MNLQKIALVAAALAVHASSSSAQVDRWAGYPVDETGWSHAGTGYLGWIWVGEAATSDWIFSFGLESYLYSPSSFVTPAGGWAYLLNLDEVELDASWADSGWYYCGTLQTWFYLLPETAGESTGWAYIGNSGESLPGNIVVTANHTADPGQEAIIDRYANAYTLSPDDIARMVEIDPEITMNTGSESITFTSTANSGNRYVRIGFRHGSGILDLTALDGISGKIAVDVLANVDLSKTTSGFYVRLKDAEGDVGTNHRLAGGTLATDMLLQTYLTSSADGAYLEITLPWQGSVTVKNVFLHMETVVTGFADMAAKITGGEGASEEDIHDVANAAEFFTALDAVSTSESPSIINISGTISYEEWVAASGSDDRQISLGGDYSNLSIIGVGDEALFDGLGIDFQGTNLIIRNITMRYVLARDAITVNDGTYVWIDHCTLYNEPMDVNGDKDKYDELIGIKNNAHSVILSWNHLHDSHKTLLVGSNDEEDALPDRKLIMHHNWFQNTGSRHPLYRGGYAHVYNNYYQNVDSAINPRINSKMLIENNYFENTDGAIGGNGLWEVHDNIFVDVGEDAPTESTMDIRFEEDYTYSLDPAEDVPEIVTAGAGAGKPL